VLIDLNGCDACPLRHEWKFLNHPKMALITPSWATPADRPLTLVVGNAPGEEEDREGKLFVGKPGRFFRKYLPSGVEKYLYWANIVRCRPPKSRIPTAVEVECCTTAFMEPDLDKLQPHVILTVGDEAFDYFVPGGSISKLRGIPIPYKLPGGTTCWIYGIYNPLGVERKGSPDAQPGDDRFNPVFPIFKHDIDKFFALSSKFLKRPTIPELPTNIIIPKSLAEARSLYARMKPNPVLDIETSKKKPYLRDAKLLTGAFSDGELTFAWPIEWPGAADKWGMDFFLEVMKNDRMWTAHNAGFELVWTWYYTKYPNQHFGDTMIKARFIYQRTGVASLDTQTQIHLGSKVKDATDTALTRAMRRQDEEILRYPLQEVLKYNGYDSWATALVDSLLELPADQQANYERALDTTFSTASMELMGLPIDISQSYELKKSFAVKADKIEEEARALYDVVAYERDTNTKMRLSAPEDVANVIVNYCKLKLPKTAQHKYSTDESLLEPLVDKHRFVRLVLDYREVKKQESTYVDPLLRGQIVGVDGLLHPSYTTVLTATGRLSSQDPNIQNFPKRKNREVRKQIIPPPGFVMLSCDYGQLEARVLAMASRDKVLSQQIIDKVDIHSKWLNKILDYYPRYLERLANKTGQTEEKQIRKYGRDIIKTDFVFASFYGSKKKSVAARTMIPESIVSDVWEEFWAEYKGVKQWAAEMFQMYAQHGYVKTLTNLVRNEILSGNEPINTPIQGTAAHIVVEAQNALFVKGMIEDAHFLPRINIHDDLTFFIPDDSDLERYIRVIGEEIVRPRFPFITVPLMTEAKIGYDWSDFEVVAKFEGSYLT